MKTFKFRNYIYYQKTLLLLAFSTACLLSCEKSNNSEPIKYNYLTKTDLITTINRGFLLIGAEKYQDAYQKVADKILFDVSVYKISYKTKDVQGNEIIASGVLMIPSTNTPVPLLSYQHCTLFNPAIAPSYYNNNYSTMSILTILASTGFVICIPDYLGYGESADYPHPYEHAESLGSASFDMLMASKEYLESKEVSLSEKLFLAGYSEGGYATMALHKHIEENSDLKITMSAPASGAYNKTAFTKKILNCEDDMDFLPRFMWVIDAYNRIYKLNRTWNDYVNEPYASRLAAVASPFNLDDADISLNPQVLFTRETINGVLEQTDTELINALTDNDIYNWKPQYSITLFYGTSDDYVFPINSESAYNAMKSKGANIDRVIYEGKNHSTTFMPYIIDMYELFESLK